MATDFKLPELGENIASGDIVTVLVKEGDVISPNQGVVEIETDKAVVEVPSTLGGKVTKIHVAPGQTVNVGAVLLSLEASGAPAAAPAKPAPPKAAPAAAAPPKPAPAAKPAPAPAAPQRPQQVQQPAPQAAPVAAVMEVEEPPQGNGHATADAWDHVAHPATPAVRRMAREMGVDLSRVVGTGQGGRITKEDLMNAVRESTKTPAPSSGGKPAAGSPASASSDNWGPVRREPLTKIRKTIAVNMARSSQTIPHVTNFDDADVTELEKMRKLSAAQYADSGIKLTMLAFVMKAVAHSLKAHPLLNATIDLDGGELIHKEYVNLGVAVDAPRGLVVPVMRNVDKLPIPQIAQQITAISEKARNNQVGIEDMRGGTFTISNLGAVGGTYSTPIINNPEVAILLVGRARKLAVVLEDQDDRIAARLMLPLSLSYDHRLVDGATATRFLNEVIGYLEAPGRLLLAP